MIGYEKGGEYKGKRKERGDGGGGKRQGGRREE